MMDNDQREILYNGQHYHLSHETIKKLNDFGVIITKDYIDNLMFCVSYYQPPTDERINAFLLSDVFSCRVFSSKAFGKTIKYDVNGTIIKKYDSPLLAVKDYNCLDAKKYLYGLEFFHRKGIIPTRVGIDFFGVNVSPLFDQKSYANRCLTLLNKEIDVALKWKKGKGNHWLYDEYIKEHPFESLTFSEFSEKCIHMTFRGFAGTLYKTYKDLREQNLENSDERLTESYNSSIKNLLLRYSSNDQSLFVKVDNLSDYKDYTGIYVLCFSKLKKIYIGQSKRSLKKRIVQHFQSPKSEFDDRIGPVDIDCLYVMCAPDYLLDSIEQDCIASVPSSLLFNTHACAGTVDSIHDKNYNPERYKFSDKGLSLAIATSIDYRQSQKWFIEMSEMIARQERAARRIKQMRPENITPEISWDAIACQGELLEYVPDSLKTKELCVWALKWSTQTQQTFQFIPQRYLTEDFAEEIVKIDRRLTKVMPKELKTDRVMIAAKYRKPKQKDSTNN